MGRFGRAASRARQTWAKMQERAEQQREAARLAELRAAEEAEEPPPPPPPPPAPLRSGQDRAEDGIPVGLKIAAGWSWRAIVIGAVVYGVLYLASELAIIVIPLLISLLLAAMLQPVAAFLTRRLKFPRTLAAAVTLVGGIAAVAGVLSWVIGQIVDESGKIVDNMQKGIEQLQGWARGKLGFEQEQINYYLNEFRDQISTWAVDNQSNLAGTGFDVLVVIFNGVTGLFLVLFITFFFLRDGRSIFQFLVRMLPERAHEPSRAAGDASWRGLVGFIRGTIFVAIVDAVGIGIGLYLLDVPLWGPLAALVFLGGFVPIVGATVTGAIAVLVALVGTEPSRAWIIALAVLGVVLAVQQLESNVLQPLIMGRSVKIHPLAIVLAVGAGVVLYGIIGALLAVPTVAVITAWVKTARAHVERKRAAAEVSEEAEPPPDSVTA